MTMQFRPIETRLRSRKRWVMPGALAVIAIILMMVGFLANLHGNNAFRRVQQPNPVRPAQSTSAVAPPNLVRPMTVQDAIKANEERPFTTAPDTPAKQFKLRADEISKLRAIDCLTQAVYYEAATEPTAGQQAVAQVVLNRMRHPGFPSTVCGVVYQGSELPTGCQFTFTCDGSLARNPIPAVWARAKKIAAEALSGHVFAAVGHSTHYHADYVVPYWADSLAKQVQIGHHIFYRLKGGLGTAGAFSQRYAGREPDLPPPPSAVEVAAQATDQTDGLLNSGLTGGQPPLLAADAVGIAAAADAKRTLLADKNKSALLIDKGADVPIATSKRGIDDLCDVQTSKRLSAAGPNDLHAGHSADPC